MAKIYITLFIVLVMNSFEEKNCGIVTYLHLVNIFPINY
jgi:hypothetical protein